MSVTPSLESVRMNSAITEHNENTSCELAETSPFYWSESKIINFQGNKSCEPRFSSIQEYLVVCYSQFPRRDRTTRRPVFGSHRHQPRQTQYQFQRAAATTKVVAAALAVPSRFPQHEQPWWQHDPDCHS